MSTDVPVLIAELLVAGVIYFEVNESRAGEFLSRALDERYNQREDIYTAFMSMPGEDAAQKASAFITHIRSTPKLRRIVDAQLTDFCRAHYMFRFSIFHRNLMIEWFPHVILRMWVMLEPYIKERYLPVPNWRRTLETLAARSKEQMQCDGVTEVAIRSGDGKAEVVVPLCRIRARET